MRMVIFDRHSRSVVIVPGIILMSIALVLLPLAHGFAWFFLSATLFGFGFGSAQPAAIAMLIHRIQLEKRGLAVSTFLMGSDGSISVGAMLLGVVSLYGILCNVAAGGHLHPVRSRRPSGGPP